MPSSEQGTAKVGLGGRTVMVPEGGLYDRHRMATDLDEVARDPCVSGVDFLQEVPKTEADSPIGAPVTPNLRGRLRVPVRTSVRGPARMPVWEVGRGESEWLSG